MRFLKKKSLEEILKLNDCEEKINEVYKYLLKKSEYGNNLNNLNSKEKNIYLVMEYEIEMSDGGFEQFFYSDVSNYVEDVYHALLVLNAQESANLLKEAIELFPNGHIPFEQGEREKLLKILLNNEFLFKELDSRYCQINIQLIDSYLKSMEK